MRDTSINLEPLSMPSSAANSKTPSLPPPLSSLPRYGPFSDAARRRRAVWHLHSSSTFASPRLQSLLTGQTNHQLHSLSRGSPSERRRTSFSVHRRRPPLLQAHNSSPQPPISLLVPTAQLLPSSLSTSVVPKASANVPSIYLFFFQPSAAYRIASSTLPDSINLSLI